MFFTRLHCTFEKPKRGTLLDWISPLRVFLRRRVVLTKPLIWYRNGKFTIVPPGYASDLSSYPVLLAPFLPSRLETAEAGVLHDWLGDDPNNSKRGNDREYRFAIRALGFSRLSAWIHWCALRIAIPWRCKLPGNCKKKAD